MDATSINYRVRRYLDDQNLPNVELHEPFYDGRNWHVLITIGDKLLGTVIADDLGNVMENVSYPKSLDKRR